MKGRMIYLLIFVSLFPVFASHYDFRKTYWGMSKEEVMKKEKGKPVMNKEDVLVYRGKVAGFDCWIEYFFKKERLIESSSMAGMKPLNKPLGKTERLYHAGYVFLIRDTTGWMNMLDYESLLDACLLKKYGEPVFRDTTMWVGDTHRISEGLHRIWEPDTDMFVFGKEFTGIGIEPLGVVWNDSVFIKKFAGQDTLGIILSYDLWETPTTDIILGMLSISGVNCRKIRIIIDYLGIGEFKEAEKKILKDF